MADRQHDLRLGAWGLLLLALVAGFWTFRLVLGGSKTPGFGDPLLYFYPAYAATYGEFARGQLPLWNPYQLCGIAWLARTERVPQSRTADTVSTSKRFTGMVMPAPGQRAAQPAV